MNTQQKLTIDQVADFEKVNFSSKGKVSGVYGIVFIKNSRVKIYVGSSVNIRQRCMRHKFTLKENKHDNSKMQKIFNKGYDIKFVILERCKDKDVLYREKVYQYMWDKKYLLNRNIAVNLEDIQPFLNKAMKNSAYCENYIWSTSNFYNGTPCKESTACFSGKYSFVRVMINNKDKQIKKHRLAYYEKTGEYPELVRHLCDNPKCYNPDHLEAGNHSDNNLDRSRDFHEEFEKEWIRCDADLAKITKAMDLKVYKSNSRRLKKYFNQGVSTLALKWEKRLNLDQKYPEIYNKTERAKQGFFLKKEVVDFIQKCEGRKYYGDFSKYDGNSGRKRNIKIMKMVNRVFKTCFSEKQISMARKRIRIKAQEETNQRAKAKTPKKGLEGFVARHYEQYTDKQILELANHGNEMPRNDYELCDIIGSRFRTNLYRPKELQGVVWNLKRKDALTSWGIEAEKLVEYFGDKYSNEELAKICCKEFGEDKGFDEGVIQDIKDLIGLVGQT